VIINLAGVDMTPRKYIEEEGHYTLKCIEIDSSRKTYNGNTILKVIFVNKEELRFIEDIVITPNTLFRVKNLSDAFGFDYDNVNVNHFVGMFLVAYLAKTKVKNSAGDFVEVLKAKSFRKSSKIQNEIPAQGSVPIVVAAAAAAQQMEQIDINEDEIPF
jgi:hypothetical protein